MGQGFLPPFIPAVGNWVVNEQNTAADSEFKMDNTKWFAQRFMTTCSAGRLLFDIHLRIPAGTSIPGGSTLDVSLFSDTNNGPTGFNLQGAFLPEQIIQWISSSIFSRPQPGKSDPSIEGGFIRFPLGNVLQNGADSVNGGSTQFHWFEFPAPAGQLWTPNKNYWFVMKTTSAAGVNIYVSIKTTSQNTTQFTYDASGNQSSSTSDFGDLFGFFVNTPGAAQVFNFRNGQTSLFDVYSDKTLGSPTTPAQGQSAKLTITEPVLGTVFPFTSPIGQDHLASEVSFTTSIVARRNNQGFIDVAIPMSAGGFTKPPGDGLNRFTYTAEVDYVSFK